MSNEAIFEKNEQIEQRPEPEAEIIESVIIDSDNETINQENKEPIKDEEAQKPKKRGRGRPPKKMTDEKQINKLKINLVEGRKTSLASRKRAALLKKIDDEEVSNAKRNLENKKIENYMNSKKLTPITEEPPKRINNMFKPFTF